jgi:hypothetical protein
MNQIPRPTVTTSAVHLKMVLHAFRKAVTREECISIAEKHKPYMLDAEIKQMRIAFKNLQQTKSSHEQKPQAPPDSPEA